MQGFGRDYIFNVLLAKKKKRNVKWQTALEKHGSFSVRHSSVIRFSHFTLRSLPNCGERASRRSPRVWQARLVRWRCPDPSQRLRLKNKVNSWEPTPLCARAPTLAHTPPSPPRTCHTKMKHIHMDTYMWMPRASLFGKWKASQKLTLGMNDTIVDNHNAEYQL